MKAPRVPWRPEPFDALRRRYPLAVAKVIPQLDVLAGAAPAPSGDPLHVFDTEIGLRLIVSLERLPGGRVGTHISASFHEPLRFLKKHPTLPQMFDAVLDSWRVIAESTRTPELLGVSVGGIAHFFVERGN